MNSRIRILLYAIGAIVLGGGVLAFPAASMWWQLRDLPPAAERPVSYEADVAPILEEHCYECHGDGRKKGGLNLETRDALLQGGKSGTVIAEDNSKGSGLVHRVAEIGGVKPMPPKSKQQLTAEQIGVLRAWIDNGLTWGDAG